MTDVRPRPSVRRRFCPPSHFSKDEAALATAHLVMFCCSPSFKGLSLLFIKLCRSNKSSVWPITLSYFKACHKKKRSQRKVFHENFHRFNHHPSLTSPATPPIAITARESSSMSSSLFA